MGYNVDDIKGTGPDGRVMVADVKSHDGSKKPSKSEVSTAETAPMDVRKFYFGQYDLLGTTMGNLRDFAGLLTLLDEHEVPPPVIDRVFPLDEAARAHEHLETTRGSGKTVLENP